MVRCIGVDSIYDNTERCSFAAVGVEVGKQPIGYVPDGKPMGHIHQQCFRVLRIFSASGDSDIAVNTIGSYKGTVPFNTPGLVQITASGPWTLDLP